MNTSLRTDGTLFFVRVLFTLFSNVTTQLLEFNGSSWPADYSTTKQVSFLGNNLMRVDHT